MSLTIGGINVDDLAEEEGAGFALAKNGRTLIIDADGPAYRAAATVKTVPTGLRKFQSEILEQIFLADCESGEAFLTHETCTKAGRFTIKAVQPYQGQRSSGVKPPLLPLVREAAWLEGAMPEFDVHMEKVVEADDAMMMLSYQLGDDGVVRSDDKDLRMTPYPYYEIKRGVIMPADPFGELWIDDSTVTPSLKGRSLKFFWAQMMMGDSADHIKGLLKYKGSNVGYSGAYKALHPLKDIEAVCNTVIDAYRAIDQNPLAEGWLLWMLRSPTDNVFHYFNELPFSDANRRYLDECVRRDWFRKPGEFDDVPF